MLRAIIAIPFLLLLVIFALSNPVPVKMGLWPTEYTTTAPVALVVLAGAAVGFIIGALFTWFPSLGARRRARRAERLAAQLQNQVAKMKKDKESAPSGALATR